MICNDVKKYLDTFVDGELEAAVLLNVENHLETCESCSALAGLKRRFKSELRAVGQIEAPPQLRAEVLKIAKRGRRKKVIWGAAVVPLAAAAAAIFALALPTTEPEPVKLATYVDDVIERHVRELPMEVKGPDPSEAATWFRGKVDFPVRPAALQLKRASFEGARLSNVRAEQAAQMIYNVDGHRVTLMIFNTRHTRFSGGQRYKLGNKNVLFSRQNGYNVAVLLDGDMAYVLSSDLPRDRMLDLAGSIAR